MIKIDKAVRKRLGGLFLLGLIIILIVPNLFKGEGRLPPQKITKFPPEIKAPNNEEWQSLLAEADNELSVDDVLIEREAPIEVQYEKVDLVDEDGNLVARAIQIGSYKNSENAQRMVLKLQNAGFNAYSKNHILRDGTLSTRVLVGPENNLEKIQEIRDSLSEQFNLSTLLVWYKP